MSSEHSESSDVMGKCTEGPGIPRCKGLFTLSSYETWIRHNVDSAAATLGYRKVQHAGFYHNGQLVFHSFATRPVVGEAVIQESTLFQKHCLQCAYSTVFSDIYTTTALTTVSQSNNTDKRKALARL